MRELWPCVKDRVTEPNAMTESRQRLGVTLSSEIEAQWKQLSAANRTWDNLTNIAEQIYSYIIGQPDGPDDIQLLAEAQAASGRSNTANSISSGMSNISIINNSGGGSSGTAIVSLEGDCPTHPGQGHSALECRFPKGQHKKQLLQHIQRALQLPYFQQTAPAATVAAVASAVQQPGLTACTHCGKRGHQEDSCWTKHPHRMPPYLHGRYQQQQQTTAMAAGVAVVPPSHPLQLPCGC